MLPRYFRSNYTCLPLLQYGRPGSEGHYLQDARRMASWGVKYIKSDNCHVSTGQPAHVNFANFSAAINATGEVAQRAAVASICISVI